MLLLKSIAGYCATVDLHFSAEPLKVLSEIGKSSLKLLFAAVMASGTMSQARTESSPSSFSNAFLSIEPRSAFLVSISPNGSKSEFRNRHVVPQTYSVKS